MDLKDRLALPEPQVHKVSRDLLELRARLDRKVQPVPPDLKDRKAALGLLGRRDRLVRSDRPVRQVLRALLVGLV